MGCFTWINSQISQFCKSRRLFFIFGAIENQKNQKKVHPSIFDFSPMKNSIFALQPWSTNRHFWDRRSVLSHFWLYINFVGQKKLNKYGVLEIHFFQNPRRYKSCHKWATISDKKLPSPILTHHMVNIKRVVYCIWFLGHWICPILFMTIP